MSDKGLKIVSAPEAKASPDAPQEATPRNGLFARLGRQRLRMLLLVGVPLLAIVIGAAFYLTGGRYITTDNAYIGAQKVLITPDIAGKIAHIAVHEGQQVKPGDELFTLDQQPYQLALEQARAKLALARTDYEKAVYNLKSLNTLADLAQKNVELKKRDLDRKTQLVASQAGSKADVDSSAATVVTAQLQAQLSVQQRDTTLSQLLGDPNLPLEKFPEYVQAKAGLDDAQRNFDHTVVRAPIAGIATQVDNIQLGRFIPAGNPVFSVIDTGTPWVEANPKETDITYLRIGQKATLEVDSFPDHTFTGTVTSVSPGTGAQFSILPPQNASGNWVKVVQRVPVRIVFDKSEDTHLLRAGMSVNVSIDTHHSRL
jgi:membrane fusion protein (multidrug efflux system)